MKIEAIKKLKKRPKSHVGKMENSINPPNWSKKLDTRLLPVHRYVLEMDFQIFVKQAGKQA